MSKAIPITLQQLQNDALQALNESFKPTPYRKITFETEDDVYKAGLYDAGWTIVKRNAEMHTYEIILQDIPEEEMWAMLKLLK